MPLMARLMALFVATSIFIIYIGAGMIIHIIMVNKFKNEKPLKDEMERWRKNYKENCNKEIPIEYSFFNASLLGFGYSTLLYGCYVFQLFRFSILLRSSVPIQDYYALVQPGTP